MIMAKKTTKKSTKEKRRRAATPINARIGVLHTGTMQKFQQLVADMKAAALARLGPNDTIEIINNGGHYADDDIGLLEDHADALVNDTTANRAQVIVAAGGPQSAIAAMDATAEADDKSRKTVPIVFTTVTDPVDLGLVNSLKTPGKHLTGMAGQTSENDVVRLNILHAFVSKQRPGRKLGVLINPGRQGNRRQYRPLKRRARNLGLDPVPRRANTLSGIARAFAEFRKPGFLGVVVTADSFFNNNRAKVIEEAAKNGGVPTIYQWREFAADGGLISFGPSVKEAYEEAGRYVARILLGEKPAKMPCSKPSAASFKIFVNKTTADRLDLTVPPTILGRSVNLIT
jgi:putative tryptophan/tyrosine transport system substrate-binding protein